MAIKAVIYCRVSTDYQRTNQTVVAQLTECLKYVKENGYKLVGDQFVNLETGYDCSPDDPKAVAAFVDDISGSRADLVGKRPGFEAMLRYLEKHNPLVVVLYSLDRLGRLDGFTFHYLENEIEQKRNCRIEYTTYNPAHDPDGIVKDVLIMAARVTNKQRTDAMVSGRRARAHRKFMGGRASYGYDKDPNTEVGLRINPEQAEVVRLIFHLYVKEGYSLRQITDYLTEQKIPNYSGRTRWDRSAIANMLANTTYIGKAYYGKQKYNHKHALRWNDPSVWIELEVPAIVDQEIFDRAQVLLEEARENRRKEPQYFYLLKGMVWCTKCKHCYAVQGHKNKKGDGVYRSYRHRAAHGDCCNKQVNAPQLEQEVWETVKRGLVDPKTLQAGYETAITTYEKNTKHERERLTYLYGRREVIIQKMNKLTESYLNPEIPINEGDFIRLKNQYDEELASCDQTIASIQKAMASVPKPVELETFVSFTENIREVLEDDDLTDQEKREILEMLNVKVWLDPDTGDKTVEGIISFDGMSNVDSLNDQSPPAPWQSTATISVAPAAFAPRMAALISSV